MARTREKILRTLLSYPGSTINDLAEAVGINGISIRHHLTALEADDLVISAEERHGVGRPRLIYSLTEKGVEKFPTGYLRLTKRMIDAAREQMTSSEMAALFGKIGSDIAQKYKKELAGKPIEECIKLLKQIMTEEGFVAEYQENSNSFILTSLSCPYHHIISDYPEICNLDYQLISEILSTPVKIETCILNGDENCTYHIPTNKSDGKNE